MATRTLPGRRPPAHLEELTDRVLEAAADPRYAARKAMWTRHNRLEKVEKTPVYVCVKRGSGTNANPVTWSELIPPETRISTDPLEREIELQLRQKLYKHDHIPDDDVLLPTVWVRAVPPRAPRNGAGASGSGEPGARDTRDIRDTGPSDHMVGENAARLWGLPFRERRSGGPGGAYAVEPVVRTEADLEKLHPPRFSIDARATAELVERATELVGGKLPVKVKTDEVANSPTETMISLMGMEAVLYGVVDRPDFIHRIMGIVTDGTISYHQQREAAGAVDPEETWGYRVQYEELPRDADTNRLAYCWTHIGAQSMCGVSPMMYEEFVQPYHERLAAVSGRNRCYYHGCEDLTRKIRIIKKLPNLRRFHVSPWTSLEAAVNELGRDFVLEVVPHPDTLHVHSPEQMRQDIERIMEIAGDCIIDIVLGEIETVFGDPSVLTRWAQIAQDVTQAHAR